ncbi:MAG TPA: methylenetetrahydrofolate reductase [NAD(P)H] [Solirubrobacterales bacterium]|jgi:methylenetetrahydrofolate reductase (NADPH)|nr:methylenetetrahydrofolate reductase [NAD(P)H] [Solirubrobacterales bacterium]
MRIDAIIPAEQPCFSFEFFPPKTPEGVEALYDTIRVLEPLRPGFVSVTYGAGGATREGTVEISGTIKREFGIETMAHLSCVGETREGLEQILDRIAAAGLENVLALRGDPPRGEPEFQRPEGGLSSSAELAAFIAERHDFALGGAGFPEVHPEAADLAADLAFLRTKLDAGVSFVITQLFFDNQVFFEWLPAARSAGIDVPVIPGVMPITSYAQIRRFCDICQATIPKPLADAMEALGGDEQAEFELGVAYAARQCEELLAGGVPGLHFYTLNKAPATRAILGALRAAKPWERANTLTAEWGRSATTASTR